MSSEITVRAATLGSGLFAFQLEMYGSKAHCCIVKVEARVFIRRKRALAAWGAKCHCSALGHEVEQDFSSCDFA